MAENLEQQAQQEPPISKKGFITSPTQDELKPSYDESYLLWKLIEDGKAAAKSQRILGEPRRTFITAPTPEQLQFSQREQALLRNLCDWNEQSMKSLRLNEVQYGQLVSYSV